MITDILSTTPSRRFVVLKYAIIYARVILYGVEIDFWMIDAVEEIFESLAYSMSYNVGTYFPSIPWRARS